MKAARQSSTAAGSVIGNPTALRSRHRRLGVRTDQRGPEHEAAQHACRRRRREQREVDVLGARGVADLATQGALVEDDCAVEFEASGRQSLAIAGGNAVTASRSLTEFEQAAHEPALEIRRPCMRIADKGPGQRQAEILAGRTAGSGRLVAFQVGAVAAMARADGVEKGIDVAVGNPAAGTIEVEHLRPILVDLLLTRPRPALQPFVGTSDIEGGGRVGLAEDRREILARHRPQGSGREPQLPINIASQFNKPRMAPRLDLLCGSTGNATTEPMKMAALSPRPSLPAPLFASPEWVLSIRRSDPVRPPRRSPAKCFPYLVPGRPRDRPGR